VEYTPRPISARTNQTIGFWLNIASHQSDAKSSSRRAKARWMPPATRRKARLRWVRVGASQHSCLAEVKSTTIRRVDCTFAVGGHVDSGHTDKESESGNTQKAVAAH
jgi:hypothetical protein